MRTSSAPGGLFTSSDHILALAEFDPRAAVRLARRGLAALPAQREHEARWRYALGWALLCWERFEQARESLRLSQDLLRDAPGSQLDMLRARYGLLLADALQGGRADMLAAFAELGAAFAHLGASREATHAWLHQAVLLNILGQPRQAGEHLSRIRPDVTAGTAAERGRWLRILAATASAQGDYAQAQDLLRAAEEQFAAQRLQIDMAKCWYELGWVAVRQERLDVALANYGRAERIFTKFDLPLRRARCVKDMGHALVLMGAYDRALERTLTALRYFTAIDAAREIAGCRLHLGNIYFQTSRWEAALACYTRAETLFAEAGVAGDRLIAQRNRAMVFRALDRYAEAQALLDEVMRETRALGLAAEMAHLSSIRAALHADAGEQDAALALYQQARADYATLGNQAAAAANRLDESWLLLRRGQIDTAARGFLAAHPALRNQPHSRWRVEYGLGRCAELRGHSRQALARYRAASAIVAALRRRLISEGISSSLYRDAARMYADALALAARAGYARDLLALSEQQRALVLQRVLTADPASTPAAWQAEHEALRGRIAGLLAAGQHEARDEEIDLALADYEEFLLCTRHGGPAGSPARDWMAGTLDVDQVREHLNTYYGDDWTALVFAMVDQHLAIACLTPDDLTIELSAYDRALARLIEQAVHPAYRDYTYRDLPYLNGQTTTRWSVLRRLADRLLPTAARTRLHARHRLIVVPCERLHHLPWAALRPGDRWLAQQAVVQIAPSLSILPNLARRVGASRAALLIGCSTFGGRALDLPCVTDELAAIAAELTDRHLELHDAQARRAALIDRGRSGDLAAYGLLHIASHAQMLPSRGLAAHIKLWDDDLWLPEIAALRLSGGIVTLSACEGAAAEALPGEELLSLSWAFLAAGAGGVIASLRSVYDRPTIALMRQLYIALGAHGDAAAALAEAQRALIDAGEIVEGVAVEPHHWASFVAIGMGSLPE